MKRVFLCNLDSGSSRPGAEILLYFLTKSRQNFFKVDRCQDSSRLDGEVGRVVGGKRPQMGMENRHPAIEPSFLQSSVEAFGTLSSPANQTLGKGCVLGRSGFAAVGFFSFSCSITVRWLAAVRSHLDI